MGSAYLRDLEFVMEGGFTDSPILGWSVTTSFYNQSAGNESNNANTLVARYYGDVPNPNVYLRRSLLFGIVQGLPGDDAPDEKHLVLFMDPTAALGAQDAGFGDVFPGTSEAALIDAIEYVHNPNNPAEDKLPYYDTIGQFYTAAEKAAPGSAWIGAGSAFSIVTFSDGNTIGNGTNTVSTRPRARAARGAGPGRGVAAAASQRALSVEEGTIPLRLRPNARLLLSS